MSYLIDEEKVYIEILKVQPDDFYALHSLGVTYYLLQNYDSAIEYLRRALEVNSTNAEVYNNLGNALQQKGQLDEAKLFYQKALNLNPNFTEALNNLGMVLKEERHFDKALNYYQKVLQLDPNFFQAHVNISEIYLLQGDFQKGWEEYEWRQQTEAFLSPSYHLNLPLWNGFPPDGKSLFISAEQGVGDEIMFASCLPDVIEQGTSCLIECDERLIPLFERSFPKFSAIKRITVDEDYPDEILQSDIKIPIGSLPSLFRKDINSFPDRKSYLIPDNKEVVKWSGRFAELGKGLKIGISWRGGTTPNIIHRRSVTLDKWAELFSLSGIHFINLQYGDCKEELSKAKEKLGISIHDWADSDPLIDLEDFAAQIAALDLVVSVDNSTIHMAGALGVPVWVLLPFICEWRWLLNREDTLWYPTMRLFRQPSPGEWGSVITKARDELLKLLDKK